MNDIAVRARVETRRCVGINHLIDWLSKQNYKNIKVNIGCERDKAYDFVHVVCLNFTIDFEVSAIDSYKEKIICDFMNFFGTRKEDVDVRLGLDVFEYNPGSANDCVASYNGTTQQEPAWFL